ncbi:MAG: IS1182 family transposase, partial [Treponema sp.]|nr:IS1182 family transposase [Treponema sp.]
MERPEKKPEVLQRFLEGAKPRIGASNESAPMKGAHGYVRGYSGIGIADGANQVLVAAEAQGSGSESGTRS